MRKEFYAPKGYVKLLTRASGPHPFFYARSSLMLTITCWIAVLINSYYCSDISLTYLG